MLEVAVCSNDGPSRGLLTQMLRDWAGAHSADVAVAAFCGAEAFFQAYAPGRFAFVFLDTDLAGASGLEAARRIRGAGDSCQIAFLSGDARHALACYEAHPAGFFLKPPDYARLCELLQWHRGLFLPAMRAITVVSARAPRKLLLGDILFIAVSGRTSLIHLKKETVATNRPLNELAQELGGAGFFRCHRGYLVNPGHIAGLKERRLLLDDGREVPVSEDRAAEARALAERRAGEDGGARRRS